MNRRVVWLGLFVLAAQLSATIQELANVDAGANPGEVP